jgi:hypothetical protein
VELLVASVACLIVLHMVRIKTTYYLLGGYCDFANRWRPPCEPNLVTLIKPHHHQQVGLESLAGFFLFYRTNGEISR